MSLYLSILTVLLLSVVAGLLLAVWMQLREWKEATREAPLLAERMAEQLMQARRGLEELKKALVSAGPELSSLLSEGGKMRVELQFLLQRAEQVAANMDQPKAVIDAREPRAAVSAPLVSAAETVAGANGRAAQPSQVTHDPLEDLLANLQAGDQGNVTLLHKSGRKRKGPVTQAELDLQQKVAG